MGWQVGKINSVQWKVSAWSYHTHKKSNRNPFLRVYAAWHNARFAKSSYNLIDIIQYVITYIYIPPLIGNNKKR